MLEINDYIGVFIRAIKEKDVEAIADYFAVKYNEHKEQCTPRQFINGLIDAGDYLTEELKKVHHESMKDYYNATSINPSIAEEQPKPVLADEHLPCNGYNNSLWGHFNISNIEAIKQGLTQYIERQALTIERLDEVSLKHSDTVYDYYLRNWKFSYINYQENDISRYKDIPILMAATSAIEKARIEQRIEEKYPWRLYIKSFLKEYEQPLPECTNNEEKIWLLRHIQPNPELPAPRINYQTNKAYFHPDGVKKYGALMAQAYKVWLLVIDKLPTFEKYFIEQQNEQEQQLPKLFPIINVKSTDSDYDCLVNMRASIKFLIEIITLKRKPERLPSGDIIQVPFINYKSLQDFKSQLTDFLREYNANRKKGVSVEFKETYNSIISDIDKALKLFDSTPDLLKYDMSFIDGLQNDNWYKYVYDWLNDAREQLSKHSSNLPPNESQHSFESTLTKPQIKKLFKALVANKYIHEETIESDFKAVFSGDLPEGHNSIKWIDKSKKRHEPNAQTLFELLYLLKPYIESKNYDTSASNEANFYRLIKNCFADVKNLPEKNPTKVMCNTPRKTLLKSIVESLKS